MGFDMTTLAKTIIGCRTMESATPASVKNKSRPFRRTLGRRVTPAVKGFKWHHKNIEKQDRH